MSAIRTTLLLAGAACALLGAPAAQAGGPNIPFCLALQENYNACIRQQQARQRGGWGGGGGGWDRRGRDYDGYDDDDRGYRRGYGDGYGYGRGGYGDGYGRGGYGGGYGRRGGGNPQAACMNWLIQIKAAGCF